MTKPTGIGRGNHSATGGNRHNLHFTTTSKSAQSAAAREWYASGRWRCGKSPEPEGAHCFKIGEKNVGTCRYCGEVKAFGYGVVGW